MPCTGPAVCDGLVVRTCNDGVMGEQIDDCHDDGACSNGRCLSRECVSAEKDRTSFVGCLFYTAEVDNVATDAVLGTSFLVTNPGKQRARVFLERLGAGNAWMARGELLVASGASGRMSRPAEMRITEPGLRVAGALRVRSDQPVTVEQIQSDDDDVSARSSGGTILLPIQVLGQHHRVMTYQQAETPDIAATANASGGAGRLIVVGTHAGTTVTFRRSKTASSVKTGLPATFSLEDVFELGDGDVFQAFTSAEGADLSGSEVDSTFPVAVFSGNISTTYGKTTEGVHTPDMAHEQMPPVAAWSGRYVAVALPPQAGCSTLLGPTGMPPGASVWRLLADSEPTTVTFAWPDKAVAVHDKVTLLPGEPLEFVATSNFFVSATKPVLLTQGMDCEPTLSLAIPADHLLREVTFAVLPVFEQMIAVVRPQTELVSLLAQPDPVLLDGVSIEETTPFVPVGGGYEVAYVKLADCPPSQQVCTHRLQGYFGVALRGMDVLASYATTMPTWGCLDDVPDPDCQN